VPAIGAEGYAWILVGFSEAIVYIVFFSFGMEAALVTAWIY